MQIQVNTDSQVNNSVGLEEHVTSVLEHAIGRFAGQITRVEVHFTDENGKGKAAGDDKRCAMEARLAGLAPIAVTHHAASVEQAMKGAADKLKHSLDHTLGRLHAKH